MYGSSKELYSMTLVFSWNSGEGKGEKKSHEEYDDDNRALYVKFMSPDSKLKKKNIYIYIHIHTHKYSKTTSLSV